ncbi:hypothetical protein PFMC_04107 [Plasmodium falciparum CAMP/Malaysia]|uniref:Uncharacterized protein n=1 Tax=Plasmodium falciparum (isolate Camp / Malaysia) TaxID=5835 RepID=A0A024X330_PLAFC|nr:hypothetical protein PFMC_04107 [Plasmodium falciparum CAMP/Malaysia]
MAICKGKYKNAGSTSDQLLFQNCCESTEYLNLYFKDLKDYLIRYNKFEELYNYCYNVLTNEIQEEHEINIRYESYLESFTSNKSEKKELKPINKQNTLKSEGEKKNKLMNVNSNVSSTCTENNNVDVFFPKCHNNNEISLKNNNNSNNSENKSLSKNLSSTFTTFAMSLNKKIFNDKSDQNEKHDNEKDNLDMLKINEQGKADDIDKTKKEKTEENEIENIDNEKKKDEQIENIKKQSSNKTVAFKMDKDDPNKDQPNDKTKNKDNGNKEGESFNKIQNEIINEFNSFLNEENDVMYFDKINGHKYLEFKNNVSDGNSALWENLIKKSNFYQIKEDFENYNKIMKQQEENEHDKGNEEKTLGDLLGMNKYESIKNKNIKDLKSTTLNTDDFCHIIKNFNINNMNGHVNLENYPLNINNKDNHFVADNLVQPTNTLNVFPDTNIKLDNKQEENGALNPLNKYFTMHDNIYYIQKAILKNNSVLYKDDNIEISLDQYYYDLNGLVKIFLKNKKIVNCYDVDIQISNKMLFPLKMKFLNFEKTLSMNSTNCYVI